MTNGLVVAFQRSGKRRPIWGNQTSGPRLGRQTKTRLVCYKKNNYKWQILILTTNQYVYLEDSCER